MRSTASFLLTAAIVTSGATARAEWGTPKAPAIPQADGYVVIPGAAVTPEKTRVYRAVYDATLKADKADQILPALNMAGSELNALEVAGVPAKNAKFVVVFHGAAIDGILDDTHYKAKFGVSNPNLAVLEAFARRGVRLYVCGQNLVLDHVDPKTLTPTVSVASDALIVLMTYQNDGYALLSF